MPKIVAEIGCNHKGDFAIAEEMISVAAKFCKVDVVKFQKRNIATLLSARERSEPHPNPAHAYGETYGEHRQALEFDIGQHMRLQDICAAHGVGYSTSVWDVVSAREIIALRPQLIKVPSAQNLNWAMLDVLSCEFGGEVHISLGMTTRAEEEKIVKLFQSNGRGRDVVLYACTSGYPVSFDDICLFEVPRLRSAFDGSVKAIGFSGHHLGIAADVGALALGAEWFERHFTLDRTWKGTDHAASLEPDGLRKLCRDLRAVSRAMTFKATDILEVERPQRQRLTRIAGG
jgi:N-acetylneuraminate synthase